MLSSPPPVTPALYAGSRTSHLLPAAALHASGLRLPPTLSSCPHLTHTPLFLQMQLFSTPQPNTTFISSPPCHTLLPHTPTSHICASTLQAAAGTERSGTEEIAAQLLAEEEAEEAAAEATAAKKGKKAKQ